MAKNKSNSISSYPIIKQTMKYIYLFASILIAHFTFGQKPLLTKDINTSYISGSPQNYYIHDGWLYFSATVPEKGEELFKTDGTPQGTSLVKDINVGAGNSKPTKFVSLGKTLFFIANDGLHGNELWKTDSSGTSMVKDIYKGFVSSGLDQLTVVNDLLIFSASDSALGNELWVSDGTETGTQILKDCYQGKSSSFPTKFDTAGHLAYFIAADSLHGNELWRTDGTDTGTYMLKDIKPGSAGVLIQSSISYQGKLFFTATNGTSFQAIWCTNGTDTGTVQFTPDTVCSYASNFCISNGFLFFSATSKGNGIELWKTNGTLAGTAQVSDLNLGTSGSNPTLLTDVKGKLFFTASVDNGRELYISDGTNAGTGMVKDLYPIQTDGLVSNLTAVDSILFFTAHSSPNYQDIELYKSNGKASGTVRVKDIVLGTKASKPHDLIAFNHKLYFSVNDLIHGDELWVSDGTTNGTQLMADIAPATLGSDIKSMAAYPGGVIFNANTPQYLDELWRSKGDTASTQLVKDLGNNINYDMSGKPRKLKSMYGKVFFGADGLSSGYDFYQTDGTSNGTNGITSGASNYAVVDNFTPLNGSVYYSWYNAFYPTVWKYTSGSSGSKVKVINASGLGDEVDNFRALNGFLVFTAKETGGSGTGNELWRSDGTSSGTVLIDDINSGTASSNPSNLTVVDTTLFFSANNGSKGAELWKTNGKGTSTKLVKDIMSGATGSGIRNMVAAKNKVYFVADDGTHGAEIWSSDGTTNGTVLLKDIETGTGSSNPKNLTMVGNVLYFVATDTVHGDELWKSDGTDTGTVFIKDINPGSSGSNIMNMLAVRSELYFSAYEPNTGQELWKSNGTASGTLMLDEVNPGPESANPALLTLFGDTLFFTADHNLYGNELWYVYTQCMFPKFTAKVGCANTPVTFTDSTDAFGKTLVSWVWNFGKGDTTASSSVQHTFDSAGTYHVNLQVQNNEGCTITTSKEITVYNKPTASFLINKDTQCLGQNIFKFQNTSTPNTIQKSYTWDYGYGSKDTSTNGTKTYISAQNYVVKLYAQITPSCRDSVSRNVTVLPNPPKPSITGKVNVIISTTDTFSVVNNIGSTYTWNITGGTQQSGGNSNEIVIKWGSTPQNATVRVSETNAAGCTSGEALKSIVVRKPVGVSTPQAITFNIYPNPSNQVLYINSENIKSGLYTLSIINELGQEVQKQQWIQSETLLSKELSTVAIPNGMYFIQIRSEGESYSAKMLVKH
jgi:ELWxxDGT repeat protein